LDVYPIPVAADRVVERVQIHCDVLLLARIRIEPPYLCVRLKLTSVGWYCETFDERLRYQVPPRVKIDRHGRGRGISRREDKKPGDKKEGCKYRGGLDLGIMFSFHPNH
jgi:hypothetical protein